MSTRNVPSVTGSRVGLKHASGVSHGVHAAVSPMQRDQPASAYCRTVSVGHAA